MSNLTPSEQATVDIALKRRGRRTHAYVYGYLHAHAVGAVRLLKEGRHEEAEKILKDAMERLKEMEPWG